MASDDALERQISVPDGVRMDRADKMLARLHPELSRSRWQKLLTAGRVWNDDRILSQTDKLRAGDQVQFTMPELIPLELRPVAMDLSILFEDADMLVINKAAGQVVHPGAGTGEDTLVHGLLHHCQGSLSGIGGKERPGIVHRLDKETSGLLLVAKSDRAQLALSAQFAERSIQKVYSALVVGVPSPDEGTIEEAIGRHAQHRIRMTCRADGRPARTDYHVERAWDATAALLNLRIHTGRTHQIRVHMKHLGHSLLGDDLYGYKVSRLSGSGGEPLPVPRVMLHARRLEFAHPVTGEPMQLETALPQDFLGLMKQLDDCFPAVESH